jgi:HEPN domain-containing protein
MNETLEWVEYAEEDFVMAKSALRRSKPLATASCFHSQQCAEKYFKAMLVEKDADFPKTHDLVVLDILCNQAGILTGFTKDELARLTGYAVHTRYPGNQPVPEDAKEALGIATGIRKFARTYLGLK